MDTAIKGSVFISYSHSSYTDIVDDLYDDLKKEGYRCFKDDRYNDSGHFVQHH